MRINQRGFTLTELMITVAVLSILAAIAVPSFSHFTRKAHLRKAQAALLDNAKAIEQFYARNHSYTPAAGTSAPDAGDTIATTVANNAINRDEGLRFNIIFGGAGTPCADYNVGGVNPSADRYCLLAVPRNANEQRVVMLNNQGGLYVCNQNAAAADCSRDL